MKKTVMSLLTLFIIFFSGCVPTTEGYKQNVTSWMGSSEAQLVRGWGVPQQVFNSGGRKYFVYNSSRNVYLPGTSPTYTTTFIGNTAYTNSYGGSAPMNLNFQCKTTFEILNEKVVSWRFEGNDCTAPESTDSRAAYEAHMRSLANQIQSDKKYTRLDLNTHEKKEWFKNLTFRLWNEEINKSTFISEGLKRYPRHQYEFNLLADKISNKI